MSVIIDFVEKGIKYIAHPEIVPAEECVSHFLNACWFHTPREHAIHLIIMPIIMIGLGYLFLKLAGGFNFEKNVTDKECPPFPLYWKLTMTMLFSYMLLKVSTPWRYFFTSTNVNKHKYVDDKIKLILFWF